MEFIPSPALADSTYLTGSLNMRARAQQVLLRTKLLRGEEHPRIKVKKVSVASDEVKVLKSIISDFLLSIYGPHGVVMVHLNKISKTKDEYSVTGKFQDIAKRWFTFKMELDHEFRLISYERIR